MSAKNDTEGELSKVGDQTDTFSAQFRDEKIEIRDAAQATAKEHNLTLRQSLRAYPKAIAWSVLLSTAVVMEGYDTLLVSSNPWAQQKMDEG